jgi:ABC-type tungstate transport system substrate-binding protein
LAAVRPSNTAIILDLARGQQEAVVQHARDLDTKAAALLGFAGLLLGLLFSSELAVHHWNALLTAGTVLLGTALLPLGATLYPLRLRLNPDLEKLAYKDDRRAMAELESLVASSLQRSIRVGMGMVRAKSRLVRAG